MLENNQLAGLSMTLVDVVYGTLTLQSHGIDTTSGFKVLPKRWIVERTFAWLDKYRRMHKDYEYLCSTSENLILAAMVRTMLSRIYRIQN